MSKQLLIIVGVALLMRYSATYTILVIAFLLLLFAYNLYTNQESLLYQPLVAAQFATPKDNPPFMQRPDEHKMNYEDIELKTKDGETLYGWFIKQNNTRECPTVIFFQENAGNIGMRLPAMTVYYYALKCNICMISYRGYGGSTGTPSEAGLIIDAERTLDYVLSRADVDKKTIFVMGRSLGGAVTTALAEKRSSDICGLILENTFTCISDMVDVLFPILRPFKNILLRLDWNTKKRIEKIKLPILFINGTSDELVPASQMIALRQAAVEAPFRMAMEVQNGKHNDTWLLGGTKYIQQTRHFISTVLRYVELGNIINQTEKENENEDENEVDENINSEKVENIEKAEKGECVEQDEKKESTTNDEEEEITEIDTETLRNRNSNSASSPQASLFAALTGMRTTSSGMSICSTHADIKSPASLTAEESNIDKEHAIVEFEKLATKQLAFNSAPSTTHYLHDEDVKLLTMIKGLMMTFNGAEEIDVNFAF